MGTLVGPVIVREGGYAFDMWTPDRGLRHGFRYRRVEDAHYARRSEIRVSGRSGAVSCETVDEFRTALAARRLQHDGLAAAI